MTDRRGEATGLNIVIFRGFHTPQGYKNGYLIKSNKIFYNTCKFNMHETRNNTPQDMTKREIKQGGRQGTMAAQL